MTSCPFLRETAKSLNSTMTEPTQKEPLVSIEAPNEPSNESIPLDPSLVSKEGTGLAEPLTTASSNWLVDDLPTATLVPVDDTPPLLAPKAQNSIIQTDSGDSLEREFLASLTTSLIGGVGTGESESVTPNLSVEHMARRRHKNADHADEDSEEEEVDKGFEQSGFGIGFAVDKNKRYRRTMEVTHQY
jgi:hypothetical protein